MDRRDLDQEHDAEGHLVITERPSGRSRDRAAAATMIRDTFDVASLATPPSSWPPLHGFDLWPDPALAFEAGRNAEQIRRVEVPAALAVPATAPKLREPKPISKLNPLASKAVRVGGLILAGWAAFVLSLVVIYRFVDPPFSNLMVWQRLTGQDVRQVSVPIESVSPNVVRAVLLSEDGRFCQHWGVDFEEMQNAIERAGGGLPRGASTISMQVTKNLFLWQSKSYIRKAIEIPLTFLIELAWPKRRIMEMYLNIAEWGPGIFGVEAASWHHFGKGALHLTEREAAQLAVALPNPIRRDAGDPGPRTRRLASDIQARMRRAPPYATSCVKTVRLPFKN